MYRMDQAIDPPRVQITGSWKFHYISWKTGVPNKPRILLKYEDLLSYLPKNIAPGFDGMSIKTVHGFERGFWWFHILGILGFLNYLPYSKHFHIILAFPNTYYSKLEPIGTFTNMESVKKEVHMMLDSDVDPFIAPVEGAEEEVSERFGAKDVNDLNWV